MRPTADTPMAHLDVVIDGTRAIQRLGGEIDVASSEHVFELGAAAAADPRVENLTLDFGAATFLDSTGLGAVVRLNTMCGAHGKTLTVRGMTGSVAKVFAVTGLDKVFHVEDVSPQRAGA